MNDRLPISGETFALKGNQPLWLDNPQLVWIVRSGAIALFAVTVKDGLIEGTRRYLFDVTEGEALFGMAPLSDNPYQIMAVALEETTLLKLTSDRFWEAEKNIDLAQKWSDRLWGVWDGEGEMGRWGDGETRENLAEDLVQLHKDFLDRFQQLEQQKYDREINQLKERERLDLQVTEGAIKELTSVFQPQSEDVEVEGTPLLVAAGAVGRALGINIRPPAKSENLGRVKDPLEAIARASRIRIRRVLLSDRWWQKDCGPLLAYLGEDRHPVALLPQGNHYEIFNPVERTRIPVSDSTAQHLAPEAWMFYRFLPDTNAPAWDLLKFALKGRGKDLTLIVLAGVAATLLGMLTPQATAILIDRAIPDANRSLLLQMGLGLLAASFGAASFELVQNFATLRLETISEADTQAAVWDRLLNLKVSFFRQYTSGDLRNRVSAISKIRQRLSGTTLHTLFNSFFSLLNLALLFVYSPPLALVAVVVALIAIVVTGISGLITRRQIIPLQKLEGEILGLMVQAIGGISKLRVAAAENRAFAYWAKKYRQQLNLTLTTQAVEDRLAAFNVMLPTVSAIIIFWLASNLIGEGLSTGTFLAFNAAFGIFISGATGLSNTAIDVLEILTLWEQAKPILAAKSEVDESKTDPGRLLGGIKLDRVTFRYRSDGPLTLSEVTIAVAPGEFIALVGPSGSGKSTLIRLLLGFETPESGTIYYDGQDLSGLDISAVRRQLGVVLQNGRIDSASIFENIASNALVTMDEVWEAARMAGLADDIRAMPMGMHTVISEGGTNLSGGQRQRLLIARALVLKPRILLLDEATSALDNRTQQIVIESLESLQVTRIVIAHRLSTIRQADRIYAIEAGRVVQQGTFEELAQAEGLFARLIARQMA
ncbi:MAG: NHLP bacteriocin export ABC transporter permease/ATPase subunit [Cyanosarcina radialis HA8281-LM2]|jgi:ATP-binding cassette subfamily C protein|nr:NHLP bacteriocin export ABC transporter permease/ATPase subunit [Cyanosarcina radialis HA8281-LM2]